MKQEISKQIKKEIVNIIYFPELKEITIRFSDNSLLVAPIKQLSNLIMYSGESE